MICSSEQLKRLLEMGVLIGPIYLTVENVNQDNVLHGREMLIHNAEDAEPDMVCSWVDSFQSMDFEVGVMVEVLEITTLDEILLQKEFQK